MQQRQRLALALIGLSLGQFRVFWADDHFAGERTDPSDAAVGAGVRVCATVPDAAGERRQGAWDLAVAVWALHQATPPLMIVPFVGLPLGPLLGPASSGVAQSWGAERERAWLSAMVAL